MVISFENSLKVLLCVLAHHSWGLHTRTPDPLQEPVQVIQMSDKDAPPPPPPDPKVDPEYSGGIIFQVLDPDITFHCQMPLF